MKTGSDAITSGHYVSECCLYETAFAERQTFTRCPKCNALTVWEISKEDLGMAT